MTNLTAAKAAKEVFNMKTKKFPVLLGTLIIGMAFGLLLAGCPGAGTGTGSEGMENPSAAVQAAQLAADINAIKPGIAKVNGTTITLTGRLTLKTNLTVPQGVTLDVTADSSSIKAEGATVNDTTVTLTDGLTPKTDLTMAQDVTLDLTADGTVLGLHDMILTVNGTVIAESNRIGLEDTAAYGIINGNGTIQLKGKGRLLDISDNRKLTLDGVTLVGVKDNDHPLVAVRSGEFIMKSGAITGNTNTGTEWIDGGGVQVIDGGTFTMEGGVISGNSVNGKGWGGGGGVELHEAAFTMSGGTISGNTAQGGERAGGGGVRVNVGGTFTMKGGTISGNTVQGDRATGGGVQIDQDGATFTMSGGEISDNSTIGKVSSNGGGVKVERNRTFTMEGGTISGNTAGGGSNNLAGGVGVGADAVFTLKGGRIQGSTDSDGFTKNTGGSHVAALHVDPTDGGTAKWGTGGTYTKGGVSQPGGSDIGGDTDDTLIAVP
jgi:hypothetical protein